MTTKPRLSFWQIWNISFGFLGIQFGWGLQLANLNRIFQTLGAEVDSIAILWIAAPVTGLIIQPIIGHMSIYVVPDATMLLLSMVGIGMAWASILAMCRTQFLPMPFPTGKFDIYMGIFNFL